MVNAVALSQYDTARAALAEARTLAEVKDIVDKAAAIGELARRAKDRTLEVWAIELRENAERELGRRIKAQPKAKGGRPPKQKITKKQREMTGPDGEPVRWDEVKETAETGDEKTGSESDPVSSLLAQGIGKKLSRNAQRLAALPDEEVERRFAKRRKVAEETSVPLRSILAKDPEMKAAERARKLQEWTGRIEATPGEKFGVLLIDPPWKFEVHSQETGMDRAAANHYPTMTLEEIEALPIDELADTTCALFLWVTVPFDHEAHRLLDAWEFEYKTQWAWGKDKISKGYWNRNKHEILLLATRGAPSCPLNEEKKWDSLILSPRAEHSRKPEWQYEMIDSYFPGVPKVELFARPKVARAGWTYKGNQVPEDLA